MSKIPQSPRLRHAAFSSSSSSSSSSFVRYVPLLLLLCTLTPVLPMIRANAGSFPCTVGRCFAVGASNFDVYEELPEVSGPGVADFQEERATTNKRKDAPSAMEGREKVALAALAALVTVVAVTELVLTVPVLMHGGSGGNSTNKQPAVYPKFLVLGDWGRGGDDNQSSVAAMMALKAESLRPDFVISTGDNFYESGLLSPADPQFDTSFRDIYHHASLQVPWHAALGNHDYGEIYEGNPEQPDKEKCGGAKEEDCFFGPLHQLDVRLTRWDKRWHCERSFTVTAAGGRVAIFFIDTTPIIDKYQNVSWADHRGGLLEQSWQDEVLELDSRLARSEAEWKLVVGHHPIRTNHNQELGWQEMEERVEPLLIKYGVQAYFCGHDHTLQYIYNPGRRYHHIVSGAGSRTFDSFFGDADSPFQYGQSGFVAVAMGAESMRVEFLGLGSELPLFAVDIPRDLTPSSSLPSSPNP